MTVTNTYLMTAKKQGVGLTVWHFSSLRHPFKAKDMNEYLSVVMKLRPTNYSYFLLWNWELGTKIAGNVIRLITWLDQLSLSLTMCLGVPIMAQWKESRLASTRTQVWSLASISGLRILRYHELWCRSQLWLKSGVGCGCGVGQQLQLCFGPSPRNLHVMGKQH